MSRPARLTVGIVSAGRVGVALGAALMRAGHHVVAASGLSDASIARAERMLPGVPLLPPDEVAAAGDLLILALPDDALEGMVRGLVAAGSIRAGQIVIHTSGAHGIAILNPAAEVGALTLALHPIMTFTGRAEDMTRMQAACIGVTASPIQEAAWHVGEALVMEMGAEPTRVQEDERALYHTALTHGANHLVTLVNDTVDLLRKAGVGEAHRAVGPLLSAALDNALRHGDRGLTGPVVRGDAGTIRKHHDALAERAPEVLNSYAAMALRTAARAQLANLLDMDAAAEITAALQEDKDND
jgi:predicted short-subunit dehydrogenase-like oxidoreductase (DUF2520 family)